LISNQSKKDLGTTSTSNPAANNFKKKKLKENHEFFKQEDQKLKNEECE